MEVIKLTTRVKKEMQREMRKDMNSVLNNFLFMKLHMMLILLDYVSHKFLGMNISKLISQTKALNLILIMEW